MTLGRSKGGGIVFMSAVHLFVITPPPFSQGECGRVRLFHADIVSAFGVNLRSLAIALGLSARILSKKL